MAVVTQRITLEPADPTWFGSGILVWTGHPHGTESDLQTVTLVDRIVAAASAFLIAIAFAFSQDSKALGWVCLAICGLFILRFYVRARRADRTDTEYAITTKEVIQSVWTDGTWKTQRLPLSLVADVRYIDGSGGLGTVLFCTRLGTLPTTIDFKAVENADNICALARKAVQQASTLKK